MYYNIWILVVVIIIFYVYRYRLDIIKKSVKILLRLVYYYVRLCVARLVVQSINIINL